MRKQIVGLVTALSLIVSLIVIGFTQIPGAFQVSIPFDFNVDSGYSRQEYILSIASVVRGLW